MIQTLSACMQIIDTTTVLGTEYANSRSNKIRHLWVGFCNNPFVCQCQIVGISDKQFECLRFFASKRELRKIKCEAFLILGTPGNSGKRKDWWSYKYQKVSVTVIASKFATWRDKMQPTWIKHSLQTWSNASSHAFAQQLCEVRLLWCLFYSWRDWSTEGLSHLPRVTQIVGRARLWEKAV